MHTCLLRATESSKVITDCSQFLVRALLQAFRCHCDKALVYNGSTLELSAGTLKIWF
jgi:hypothetical protein